MKKKLCVFLVLFAMVMSMFAPAMFAEEDTTTIGASEEAPAVVEGPGGLDFYSVTVHYEKPVLVDYVYKGKKYLFVDDEGNQAMSDEYIWRAGTTKSNGYYANKTSKSADRNFYQMQSVELGIPALAHYSKVPYNYAYITHIQNNAVIKTRESVNFFGITEPYDEGDPYVNKNPNIEYDSKGYAIDVNTDDEGNNYRIDINNYRITKDDMWLDNEGQRVELFYQKCQYVCTGRDDKGKLKYSQDNIKFMEEYEMFPFDKRYDENGMIRDVSQIKALQYVTNDEMDEFIDKVTAMLDADPESVSPQNPQYLPFHVTWDEEEMASMTSKENKKNYKFPKNDFSYKLLYKISKDDPAAKNAPADASATADPNAETPKIDDAVYYSKDTIFTKENIALSGEFLAFGTPVQGEPKLNVKIKDISVEIDAVGDKIYDNAEEDPQNKNTIVISLNDFEGNCIEKKAALDEGYITQKTYDDFSSMILGTIHSKTTSTAPDFSKENLKTDESGNEIEGTNWKSTVQSIYLNLDEETLAKLPSSASIFLNFHIETQQPEEAFDLGQCKLDSKKSSLVAENAVKYKRPSEPLPTEKPANTGNGNIPWNIIIPIIAGVVVLAVVIVLIAVIGKKKKAKKAE
ncbi:MAG: hypothetical protein J6X34_05035 [Clostridia bacterium]|nr:hypothetical protein [Clostridia bacterium]MBP5780583.1 hypothetical protein [Clostridia bacterium]